MSDAIEGLSAPERCDNCNGWVETAVGMDSYVTINDYGPTEHDHYVFCDWGCASEWFEDDRSVDTGTDHTDTDKEINQDS